MCLMSEVSDDHVATANSRLSLSPAHGHAKLCSVGNYAESTTITQSQLEFAGVLSESLMSSDTA